MNVTIIGTGKMARAISTRLLAGGNNVNLVGHSPGKAEALAEELKNLGISGSISAAMPATLPGEVVILAIPYVAAEAVVHQYIEFLPGKILVDITNPIDYQTMELTPPPGSSAAEEIARLAPVNTRVLKAFNTTFAGTLQVGKVAGQPLDVFIAGDDAESKLKVAQLIESGGLRAMDVGSLARARLLEALGLLHVALQNTLNTGFMSTIKVLN